MKCFYGEDVSALEAEKRGGTQEGMMSLYRDQAGIPWQCGNRGRVAEGCLEIRSVRQREGSCTGKGGSYSSMPKAFFTTMPMKKESPATPRLMKAISKKRFLKS